MTKNVGSTDKLVRIVVGLVLVVVAILSLAGLPVVALGGWAWLVGLIGLVLVATGYLGFCALYTLLGINTCKTV
jgi:hypothetical protein